MYVGCHTYLGMYMYVWLCHPPLLKESYSIKHRLSSGPAGNSVAFLQNLPLSSSFFSIFPYVLRWRNLNSSHWVMIYVQGLYLRKMGVIDMLSQDGLTLGYLLGNVVSRRNIPWGCNGTGCTVEAMLLNPKLLIMWSRATGLHWDLHGNGGSSASSTG